MYSRKKRHFDDHDLIIGPDSHGRSPDSGAGCDNGCHGTFFQDSAGVFPEKMNDDVCREHLPVVRVTGEIKIDSGISSFREFTRLMVHDDDGTRMIERFSDVGAERQRRYRAMKRWRTDPTEENFWGVVVAYGGGKI